MTPPSDLTLQLALAKEPAVAELIERFVNNPDDESDAWYLWRDTQVAITPREWDWITRECLRQLTEPELILYIREVDRIIASSPCFTIIAPWQTRAIAYFKTKGIEL